jgi:hypothetical protein
MLNVLYILQANLNQPNIQMTLLKWRWLWFVKHHYQFSLQCIPVSVNMIRWSSECVVMVVQLSLCLIKHHTMMMDREANNHIQAPTTLHLKMSPGTHWTVGWVGPRANLDMVSKTNNSAPVRAHIQSPYCLSYPVHIRLPFSVSPFWSASWYRQGGKH